MLPGLGTYHSRFCPLRNKKAALYFVAVSVALTVLTWRDLGKPFSNGQGLYILLLGHLTALALLGKLFVLLKCLRERLTLALGIVSVVAGLVTGLVAGHASLPTGLIRGGSFLLWVVASGISISMLFSSLRGKYGGSR